MIKMIYIYIIQYIYISFTWWFGMMIWYLLLTLGRALLCTVEFQRWMDQQWWSHNWLTMTKLFFGWVELPLLRILLIVAMMWLWCGYDLTEASETTARSQPWVAMTPWQVQQGVASLNEWLCSEHGERKLLVAQRLHFEAWSDCCLNYMLHCPKIEGIPQNG